MTSLSPEVDDLVQQMMAAYAQDAVSIRRGWIRRLLRLGVSDDQLDTICRVFGGYVGEVIRRYRGGRWAIIDSPTGEGNVIALVNGDDKIFPPAKIFTRLVEGESDNVWYYFQVITEAEIFGARSRYERSTGVTGSDE